MTNVKRRLSTLAVGAIPVVALAALASTNQIPGTNINTAVPFAAQAPGPMFNTLGTVDSTPVVEISGAQTFPTSGELNMTTVSVYTNMSFFQALNRRIFHGDDLIPIEYIFPSHMTQEETNRSNQLAFTASEANATVAALRHLGRPLAVEVGDVLPDTPAHEVLKPHDLIVAVDGKPVDRPSQVRAVVLEHLPGQRIGLSIQRDGQLHHLAVELDHQPDDPDKPLLGVLMSSKSADGINVGYHLNEIGGPSAGMMFSLAVLDKLTPEDLTGGHRIAGTGTIDEEGKVGPIGGIKHKVEAAKGQQIELFLAPEENCAEALSAKPKNMAVAKVNTLDDALGVLQAYNAGQPFPTCGS